jgi:hypothetical protein
VVPLLPRTNSRQEHDSAKAALNWGTARNHVVCQGTSTNWDLEDCGRIVGKLSSLKVSQSASAISILGNRFQTPARLLPNVPTG